MKLTLTLIFLVTSPLSLACNSPLKKKSIVGENAIYLNSDDYNNGYPEKKYNQVLDTFIQTYTPIIAKRGGTFHILRDFSDGAVNAWAWRMGSEYHLEVPGGMSKYYLISEEGFITTVCHELGHLLGGVPTKRSRLNISSEGQSDYFSTSKCLNRMLSQITPFKKLKNDPEVEKICKHKDITNCKRAFSGMKSLSSYYAKLERVEFPSLFNDSTRVVRQTLLTHPKSQCRLDTMKRGYLCPVDQDEDFSFQNSKTGACHLNFHPEFARPKCWYKEPTSSN